MGDSAEKKILDKIGAGFFRFYYDRVRKMSYKQIDRKAKFYSSLYSHLDKKRIETATENLKKAFGEKSDTEISKMIKEVLYNFVVEFYMFFKEGQKPYTETAKLVDFAGKENIEKYQKEGKGVILLTAHIGNWEILARKLCAEGYKVSVIARDSDHTSMTDITNQIRNNGGYSVYSKDRPVIGIIKALKRGECIGILPDQNNDEGIWVEFFGRPAQTAAGTAVFSLKTETPIVPVFCIREQLGKYRLEAWPAIEFDKTDNFDEDVKNLTQKCNDVLEKGIRKYPTSWLWIHNRWKKNKNKNYR